MVREIDDRIDSGAGSQAIKGSSAPSGAPPGLLLPLGEGLKLVHKADPTTCKIILQGSRHRNEIKADPVIYRE